MSNVVHRSIRKTALPRTGRTLDAVPSSATGSGSGSGAVGSSGSGLKDHSQLTGVISTIDEYKDSAKDIHLTATDADALKRLSTLEIIESTDTETIPGETNVYSAAKSKKEDEKRLRNDVPDTAKKVITFLEGLVTKMKAILEAGADFGADGSGGYIEATGEAEFLNLFLREYLKTDKIQSQEFHAGALGTGFLIKRDPVTGRSYMEVDELFVRIKAFFTELEIKKLSYAGGNWVFSAAGMKCIKVEDKGTFYRCYFTASDGETTVKNEFRVDDQCRSQEFNVKTGISQNVSSRYYWRLCIAVGDDYIDLSKADCDINSDAPIAGDSIVQLGNRTDVARQNAILISAYGEGSPSMTQHTGINSYSLEGTEKIRISPELNKFTGEFHFTTGENIKDEVDVAKASAATAVGKADAAQGTATAAKNRLDTWASDGVISPTEKVTLRTEQTNVRAEKIEIVADAVKYNVSATAYVNAYTAYDTDLTYYTNATPENITILPTFATRQTAYYSARTAILANIATAAKKIADDAQYSANQAKSDAATAQTKANQADTTANAAKTRLDGWAADNTISPTEKAAVKDEIVRIDADKNEIISSYTKYGLGTPTAFNTAHSTYRSQLVALSATTPENIAIPANFATNQTAYYTQRTASLNAIATTAKSYVDTGVGSAKSYTDTTFSAVDGKITLAVDNVKIGTRNLLLDSGNRVSNGNYLTKTYYSSVNLIARKEYTIICKATTTGGQRLGVWIGGANYHHGSFKVNQTNEIGYFPFQVHINVGGTNIVNFFNLSSIGSAANPATIEWAALYEGNIKPPINWTPAPEDQTAYADNVANVVRTETNTKLEVIDGKIAQTVTKTEFNNLQIGGENLLLNSGIRENTNSWYLYPGAGRVTTNDFQGRHSFQNIQSGKVSDTFYGVQQMVSNCELGDIFTCGLWCYTDNLSSFDSEARIEVWYYNGNTKLNAVTKSIIPSKANTWEYFNLTTLSAPANANSVLVYAWIKRNGRLWMNGMKLERGNKATAWSPAPEDTVQEGKDYANTTFPTKTEYQSSIIQLSDKIEQTVTKTEYSAGLSDAAIIASISPDMMLNTDPTFKNGYNGTVLYGSSLGTAAYARMPLAGLPNDSGYCLKMMNTGAANPGLGGFGFGTMLVANVAFVTKIVAKIPAGYGINWASNGGYGERRWLTSNLGDGTWREYIYYVKSLPSGTFNTTNYFYLSGTPGVEWYVAFATVYRLNSYQSYPTTTEYQTKITQLENSISFKASQSEVTGINTRLTQAEIKLQPDNIWLGISDKTVAATRKTVDLLGLNQNTYYPVTFNLAAMTTNIVSITVSRTLDGRYGVPDWSRHASGFSIICSWDTNGSGWGTSAVSRRIKEYTVQHVSTSIIPVGSVGQMTNSSNEYIYLRGGSKYDILVESKNTIGENNINLRTSAFTASGQTIDLATSVTQPLVDIDQKITADDLLPTGIDIKNHQITVTAPTFRVQNNAGTPIAVFTTNAAGQPVLRAENIDVDNLTVKKISGATGTFDQIVSNDDRMKLYGGGINFRDSRNGITAALGNEAVSAASGLSTSMYIERDKYEYGGTNISAILSAKGMWCYDTIGLYGNVALSIPYGKIAGLRVYVRRIDKSITYGTSGIMDNWLIVIASGVTITLPNMTDEMDGHIIVISNRSSSNVIINGPGYDGNSRALPPDKRMMGCFCRTGYGWDYVRLD